MNCIGCASWINPTADVVDTHIISYDNGVQNGGIIDIYTYINSDNIEIKGFLITDNAKSRYNALIEIYGENTF